MAARQNRILFARVGWMTYYKGEEVEPIIGGGDWNEKHEVYNFHGIGGRLYGFAQAGKGTVSLERIVSKHHDDVLPGVLVVFFAADPDDNRGQVIVGWYRQATVHRGAKSPPKRIAGKRKGRSYFFEADIENCCLLPRTERVLPIPRGMGATGYSMITYALGRRGEPLRAKWVRDAIRFVRSYRGDNLLSIPATTAMDVAADAATEALAAEDQGRALSPSDRREIERHAVSRARAHLGRTHRIQEKGRPFDLLCTPRKGAGLPLYVEVKGTQSLGGRVILTENEVRHATINRERTILFLVHSIRVVTIKGRRRAVGGTIKILRRWSPAVDALTPIAYVYRLP